MLHWKNATKKQNTIHLHVRLAVQTKYTHLCTSTQKQVQTLDGGSTILHLEASRAPKLLDACLETGSSEVLNAVLFLPNSN